MTPTVRVLVFALLFGFPMLGVLYAAPLILGHRIAGRLGLWVAALVCTTGVGWAVVSQGDFRLHEPLGGAAVSAALFLAWGVAPAYLVDRASAMSPQPPIWKRVAYSIGGMYVGTIITMILAMLVVVAAALARRFT